MSKKKNFIGPWRIINMELWDSDFIDLEGPGYIQLTTDGMGEFHFGAVHGCNDWRYEERDGQEAVEFSWEGSDEGDAVCGRGWATLDGHRLVGHLFFHQGDDSSFVAVRQAPERRKGKKT